VGILQPVLRLLRLLFQQPGPRLQLSPEPVEGLAAEASTTRLVEVSCIPALPVTGQRGGAGIAVAVEGLRAGEELRLGSEDLGEIAGARRVLLLVRDDYPDIVQDALAEEPFLPRRKRGAGG
jgi:hypothetical protein